MSQNVNITIDADGSGATKALQGVGNSLDTLCEKGKRWVLVEDEITKTGTHFQRWEKIVEDTSKSTDGLSKSIDGVSKSTQKLNSVSGKTIAVASAIGTIIGNLVAGAFRALSQEVGSAVQRLDTLNNFPKVMANLKISSEDADKSIAILSEKLKGLPTSLDDAAQSVQRFTSANGNIKASTAMFLALNNAILAGGASTQLQRTALEQMSQAYTKGRADAMEWRAMLQAMPAQMNQIAQAMGYTSAALGGDLQTALNNGEVSMNDFMATIVRLNNEGVNGFASFADQAMASTNGVQTSITNLKLAIQRGLADIMNAIGQANIAGFFNGIAKAIGTATTYIVAFIKVIMTAINAIKALFGKGSSQAKATSTNIGSASANTGALADNANDASGALGGANKAAKALKQTLAGFDEMNVITEPQQSSGGGGGGSGAGGGSVGGGSIDGVDWDSLWDDFDTGASKADEIAERIRKAFEDAFDAISKTKAFKSLQNAFSKVGNALVKNWTSAFDSLKSIANTTFSAVGNSLSKYADQYDSAIAHLFEGLGTLGEGLINLLATPLTNFLSGFDSVWQTVAQSVTDSMVQARIVQLEFYGEMTTMLGELGTYIGEAIAPGFEALGGLMAQMLADWTTSIAEYLPAISQNFIDFFTGLTEGAIKPAVNLISTIWNDMCKTLQDLWNKYGKGISDGVMEWIKNITDIFNKVWTDILEPIIKPFLEQLLQTWENTLKPAFEKLAEFVAKCIQMAIQFDNKVIMPIRKLLIDILKPVFVTVFTFIGNLINTVFTAIGGVFNGFLGTLNGILDFINNVFKGNWEGAWNAVKSIFSSIVSGIGEIFKAPINVIIDGINAFLAGLNNIRIPDWVPVVGGLGFHIDPIPRLAKGGIVDGATTAIIGESGREAVLPLENNVGWIAELAQQIDEQRGSSDQPMQVIVNIGEDTILDKIIDGVNERSTLSGRNAILV